jgi:hypothetical protein
MSGALTPLPALYRQCSAVAASGARPPDPAADVVGEGRYQQRAHYEGVEQDAEADDEGDLGQTGT